MTKEFLNQLLIFGTFRKNSADKIIMNTFSAQRYY